MLESVKRVLGAAGRTARSRMGREARRQIAVRDGEITALRKELARVGGDGSAPAPSGAPVFFVVGQQKSGTTWLMRMLDAHPEILCKGEGRFFDAGWRQKSLKESGVLRPPSSLYNAMLNDEYLRLWIERSVWSRDEAAEEHLNNLTRMSIDYFLQGALSGTGKKMVGDKSPLLTPETVREISDIYPEARVIHIIRDGRDAAVSAAHHARNFGKARGTRSRAGQSVPAEPGESIFTEGQLGKLAADWSARVGRAVEDGPARLGTNYQEVRYENLLQRPEEELRRLLAFLGAGAGEEDVRRCVGSASFEKLSKGRKRGEEDASSFFRKGVAGDWEGVFTEQDRRIFEEVAGALLVRLGYESGEGW